jgi:hypothetical protein
MDINDPVDSEVRRLAHILDLLVRMSGRSHRSIEAELGYGHAVLSKILLGDVRLQTAHILKICEVLEVEPYHFFKIAYSSGTKPPGPLILKVRAALGLPPVDPEDSDLERSIKRVLRKYLKDVPPDEP